MPRTIDIEWNDDGSQRSVVVDGKYGRWTGYDFVAFSHDRTISHLSDYWEGDAGFYRRGLGLE